ncbi:MAG TPA: hypothetical protein VHO47_03975 [Candidatus Babeliales bacterium]|nr:hypothetical protein [Candidatus Babeliales bacterium]
MKKTAFISLIMLSICSKELLGMESPILPRKDAPSPARQFLAMIEKLKSSKESVDATPLSPKSIGDTLKTYPDHKLLRVDEKGGFLDLLVEHVRVFDLIMPLNSVTVVPYNSGMYLLVPRKDHSALLEGMMAYEKRVLDYNCIDPLNETYIQLYAKNVRNESLRRHSANKNEQYEQQLQQLININDTLKSEHAKCEAKLKNQGEQITKLQNQLAHQNMMNARIFTKKAMMAAGIGSVATALGFAAYLTWWHKK